MTPSTPFSSRIRVRKRTPACISHLGDRLLMTSRISPFESSRTSLLWIGSLGSRGVMIYSRLLVIVLLRLRAFMIHCVVVPVKPGTPEDRSHLPTCGASFSLSEQW